MAWCPESPSARYRCSAKRTHSDSASAAGAAKAVFVDAVARWILKLGWVRGAPGQHATVSKLAERGRHLEAFGPPDGHEVCREDSTKHWQGVGDQPRNYAPPERFNRDAHARLEVSRWVRGSTDVRAHQRVNVSGCPRAALCHRHDAHAAGAGASQHRSGGCQVVGGNAGPTGLRREY